MTYDCLLEREAWPGGGGGGHTMGGGGGLRRGDAAPYIYIYIYISLSLYIYIFIWEFPKIRGTLFGGGSL